MENFITGDTPVTDAVLNLVAHVPTRSLDDVASPDFFARLTDHDFMRLAYLLARKGFNEGGCPIGGVVIDNETRRILGKGHNTLVQDGDPYNHGETSAMKDAGRIDFSKATIFTSLDPCPICRSLLEWRGVGRVVIGDVTNASGAEEQLKAAGIQVDILEDADNVAQYRRYREESPDLDMEDWKGKAGLRQI